MVKWILRCEELNGRRNRSEVTEEQSNEYSCVVKIDNSANNCRKNIYTSDRVL